MNERSLRTFAALTPARSAKRSEEIVGCLASAASTKARKYSGRRLTVASGMCRGASEAIRRWYAALRLFDGHVGEGAAEAAPVPGTHPAGQCHPLEVGEPVQVGQTGA